MQAQQGHELIFVLRQLRVDTRDIDAVLVIVDEQVAGLEFTGVGKLIVGGQRAGMAEGRADAGEQLLGAERLGQIIIRPGVERGDLVPLVAARGDDHNRHLRPLAHSL